jgi:ATP-dependent DNA helicase MPH1
MDDDFDDGIADEDFLSAFEGGPIRPEHSKASASIFSTQTVTRDNGSHYATPAAISLELEDLPSDAFSSPEPAPDPVAGRQRGGLAGSSIQRSGLSRVGSGSFRQTTLFGGELSLDAVSQTQSQSLVSRVFRADLPREEPSHHELNREAMQTWVYPTNLGATRDYQFSIVKNSLFNNTLVALPTGLGKTFIAATVMLNFYHWTKSAKIVFVAPTKPLVAQQIDACYNIAGIPRSDTTLLTGDVPPVLRGDEWTQRRVFFMTPQTLLNDLSHGFVDPKSIVLLVIDEAHRATGEYAYAKVAKFIRRFSNSIRVLALTATPGSKVETVQEVIDNLGISHCEIRTEESIDIRQYVHQRNIEKIILDPSDEMNRVCELFTKALQPLVDKLSQQNIFYGRNPMALTAFGLLQTQKEWFATRGRSANQALQGMMRAIFSVLTSIAHSIKLLNFHGIKPFYDNLVDMRNEQEGRGEKGSKYKRQLIKDASFQEMMDIISKWLKTDGFIGHPKLTALADCTLNHFLDRGEATRIIVFSEYRDSAEDIVRTLNKHRPLVKARIFVGQADSKRAEGMKQAQQIETIEKFRKGEFNVLVATSIGEEGLDIGQVDLIICYDSSASPIRMLQRMGRTGRKREGSIVLLLMRGKEEEQFAKSKDNYEKMQKLICEGSRFNFRFDLSTRIVPRDIQPRVDQRHVEIPIENTQNTSLPEPKKRKVPAGKKKPPKKFHMPEGVETGFRKLSEYLNTDSRKGRSTSTRNPELDDLADIPSSESVLLGDVELKELNRSYRDLPFSHGAVEETAMPSMAAHYQLQRQLRPVVFLKHGRHTKKCVKLLRKISNEADSLARPRLGEDISNYGDIPVRSFVNSDDGLSETETEMARAPSLGRKRQAQPPDRPETGSRNPRPQKKRKSGAGNAGFIALADESQDEEEELEEEEDSDNIGLTARLSNARRKNKSGRGQRNSKKSGINSDEVGDDCERDSDLVETDGSDDGEDLIDFIVSDNGIISSMPNVSSSLPPTSQATPQSRDTQYYIPTAIQATQDSEPDLDTLVGITNSGTKGGIQKLSEVQGARRAGRARRQVVDSDSDG